MRLPIKDYPFKAVQITVQDNIIDLVDYPLYLRLSGYRVYEHNSGRLEFYDILLSEDRLTWDRPGWTLKRFDFWTAYAPGRITVTNSNPHAAATGLLFKVYNHG